MRLGTFQGLGRFVPGDVMHNLFFPFASSVKTKHCPSPAVFFFLFQFHPPTGVRKHFKMEPPVVASTGKLARILDKEYLDNLKRKGNMSSL